MISLLGEVGWLAGRKLVEKPSTLAHERLLGFKTDFRNGITLVNAVYPGSPSAKVGLLKDDEIIAVNGIKVENNLPDLVDFAASGSIELTIFSNRKLRTILIGNESKLYYSKFNLEAEIELTQSQLKFRQKWLRN